MSLTINNLQAQLNNFSGQSYVVANMGGQQATTSLVPGSNPTWQQPLSFNVPPNGNNVIDLSIYPDGSNDINGYIGKALVSADPMVAQGSGSDWFNLADSTGQNVGKINVGWGAPQSQNFGGVQAPQQVSTHAGLLNNHDLHGTEPDDYKGPMWRGPGYGALHTRTGNDLPDYNNSGGNVNAGTLHVRPMKAKLSHNLDHFSQQDPYVIVELGNKVQQSSVHPQGGQNPTWNDNLTYNLDGSEKDAIIKIFDHDQYSEHDYIGGRMIPANKLFDSQSGQKWVLVIWLHKLPQRLML